MGLQSVPCQPLRARLGRTAKNTPRVRKSVESLQRVLGSTRGALQLADLGASFAHRPVAVAIGFGLAFALYDDLVGRYLLGNDGWHDRMSACARAGL